MPFYDYDCQVCGAVTTVLRSISERTNPPDDVERRCRHLEQKLRTVYACNITRTDIRDANYPLVSTLEGGERILFTSHAHHKEWMGDNGYVLTEDVVPYESLSGSQHSAVFDRVDRPPTELAEKKLEVAHFTSPQAFGLDPETGEEIK